MNVDDEKEEGFKEHEEGRTANQNVLHKNGVPCAASPEG